MSLHTCSHVSAGSLMCYCTTVHVLYTSGLPWWLSGKESACQAGDMCSQPGSGSPLEKEMATHSNILAWKIPWTEEPGGL